MNYLPYIKALSLMTIPADKLTKKKKKKNLIDLVPNNMINVENILPLKIQNFKKKNIFSDNLQFKNESFNSRRKEICTNG